VSGVTLRKHGQNIISAYAEDEAGNKSGTKSVGLIYNNAPVLVFLNPRPNRGLNHKTSVEFSVSDPDGDAIVKTILSMKKPGETSFKSVDVNSPDNKFELDVSSFPEGGGYEMKLESGDGVSASSKTIQFYVDNTRPTIFVEGVPSRNFKKDFRFEAIGYAEDGLSGVEFVEYSLDEAHWFKAIITKGMLTKRASFRVRHPFTLDDGVYEIKFRSVDAAGNYSSAWAEQFVVDTMPPRLGSYELSYNGISLYPDEEGFIVVSGKNLKIRASFEAGTKNAHIIIGDIRKELTRGTDGLWEGEFTIDKFGSYEIRYGAKDDFGNAIDNKRIGTIGVVKNGTINVADSRGNTTDEVVEGADIGVYIFSEDRQRFERWPGEYYGIANPAKSESDGSYALFLPAGKYQIYVQKEGFVKLKTNEFSIGSGKFLNYDFSIKRREGVRGAIEDMLEKIMIF